MDMKQQIAYLAHELGVRAVYQVNPTKCKDFGIYSNINLDQYTDEELMELLTQLLEKR